MQIKYPEIELMIQLTRPLGLEIIKEASLYIAVYKGKRKAVGSAQHLPSFLNGFILGVQ